MAQAFNWDEHPIAKAEPTKSKEFNWDEHPIESKQEASTFSITPRGLMKGALSALPTAGGAAGGFVGSAAVLHLSKLSCMICFSTAWASLVAFSSFSSLSILSFIIPPR